MSAIAWAYVHLSCIFADQTNLGLVSNLCAPTGGGGIEGPAWAHDSQRGAKSRAQLAPRNAYLWAPQRAEWSSQSHRFGASRRGVHITV